MSNSLTFLFFSLISSGLITLSSGLPPSNTEFVPFNNFVNSSQADETLNENLIGEFYTPVPNDTPPPTPWTGPEDPTQWDDQSNLSMGMPSNVTIDFELSDDGEGYYIHQRVGGIDIAEPSYITMEEYLEWRQNESMEDYWATKSGTELDENGKAPGLSVELPKGLKEVFGGGPVEIRPNGTALLDLGAEFNRMQNPSLPIRQQRTANFKFDQNIQLNVIGKIGDKLRLNANWDTQATFDFENQIKLVYNGTEDEILQEVSAGNVSLPLNGSLISGGQNLFGIKTAWKFGPLTITTIASQQKGKTQALDAKGGSQITNFEKKGNEYDEYRHFFLSHYFRSRYERSLTNPPVVISDGIQITRVEVWITNNNNASTQNNRNAVGFIDLGESEVPPVLAYNEEHGRVWNPTLVGGGTTGYPSNGANGLYSILDADSIFSDKSTVDGALNGLGFTNAVDFEKIENMRRLNDNEFTFHPQLGYISVNTSMQASQVLYVSYQLWAGGQTYQVGDFTNDPGKQANQLNSNVLFLKMIKPSSVRPIYGTPAVEFPTWDLMMKNIYNIGGYGLKQDNFRLEVKFDSRTQAGTISYLPTGAVANKPLLQVFNIDKLTNNNEGTPDNVFDFIPAITINPEKGHIIFPVLEPFGSHLANKLNNVQEETDKYVFQELYDKTRQDAIQYFTARDRFFIKGSYQGSSSSEISLNSINVAPGSVKVTANNVQLIDGIDYSVDYNVGKVTILNPGVISSGKDIKITYETNSMFGIDSKTLVGSRFDFNVAKDFLIGATVLNLKERPLTNKIVLGEEPVDNTIIGIDGVLRRDSRLLTKWVDAIPLLQTKEVSNITFQMEGAALLPGHPKAIQVDGENGIVYLDDFESAKTTFDLMGFRSWAISAFPGDNGNNNLFIPSPGYNPVLSTGFSRARLAWYSIDPSFYYQSNDEIFPETDLSNHYTRQVKPQEVFPNQTTVVGDNLQRTFDLHYFPAERGPYNFEVDPSKLNSNGTFINPSENWAGITRKTGTNTDFEQANYEFIEFWLLDPFINDNTNQGEMFLNLGRISEDALKDNSRSFENGLPPDPSDLSTTQETPWARVPITNPPTNAFNNDADARQYQDVGLDGVWDEEERNFKFKQFIDTLGLIYGTGSQIYLNAFNDPSSDNYHYFRGTDLNDKGILERYKKWNGSDGNTPINSTQNGYSTQGSPTPDSEDLNSNGTLNTAEEYFEYKIKLNSNEMSVGRNYIVDVIPATVALNDGTTADINWYQFRVPLLSGTPINQIQNFKAIEFVRLYLKGFEREAILRFAKLQIVSTSWRTYRDYMGIESDTTIIEPPTDLTTFEIGTVNIEENSNRLPFHYVLPPKVNRQIQFGSPQNNLLANEQSLVMKVCNLQDGDARGAFRLASYDLRSFKTLHMWVHAEDIAGTTGFEEGDFAAFIRLGSDNSMNYYEYEIPLKHSVPGIQDSTNIWINEFNFALEDLNSKKARRNAEGFPVSSRYYVPKDSANPDGDWIAVIGTPKISEMKTMMVGIRNRKNGGAPICAEVWVNELRVTDFNEKAGWAFNARMNIKLADWATISVSGARKTPGFGGLEQRINSRSREDIYQFDVSGNFQMGKFLPAKWGVEIPMYLTYGRRVVRPEFNPLESDVKMENYLHEFNPEDQILILDAVQDFTEQKSISFNNVRKTRVAQLGNINLNPDKGAGGTNAQPKTHPWDIENFSVSYAYNQTFSHNATTQSKWLTNHKGSFNYQYQFMNKPFEPFKKAKKKNIITAFNFNPLPKTIGFSIVGDRQFEENIMRQTSESNFQIPPTYFKNFLITRTYNLRWDLTRGLSVMYNASNISRVGEPHGRIDSLYKRDSVLHNLFGIGQERDDTTATGYAAGHEHQVNIGRNNRFNQTMGVNLILPFEKFKMTNWIRGNASYNAGFNWQIAPDNNADIGNIINNSQNLQGTANINLGNLYSKVKFLKKIIDEARPGNQPQTQPGKPGQPVVKPDDKKEEVDSLKAEDQFLFLKKIGKEMLRIVLSIQQIDFTYSRDMATSLPGYMPLTDNFGLDFNYRDPDGNTSAMVPPSFGFIAGMQPDLQGSFLEDAANNGWISRDPSLATNFTQTKSEQLTGRTTVTFFKDFKVDLNISRTNQTSYSERFYYDSLGSGEYLHNNQLQTGTYSMSYIFANTAFEKNEYFSKYFLEFQNNDRRIVSERLAFGNHYTTALGLEETTDAYWEGYYRNSQDVLLPAFLSAYSVAKPSKVSTDLFPKIPLPNWTVNYNGLSKLPMFKRIFNSVTIKHTYRGTYSIPNYLSNIIYEPGIDGFTNQLIGTAVDPNTNDSIYNFVSKYQITAVSFQESFSPLAGVNFSFKNKMTASIDYKMNRNVTLNVGPMQLNETRSKDLSVSFAWLKDKLNQSMRLFGRDIKLENSLNTRIEVTYRDSKTRNRMLDSKVASDYTAGNSMLIIKPSVDYVVNTKLNIQFYVEHSRNKPAISTSFPSSYTGVGFKVRFTLAQ